jgi:sulfur carrier protein
VKLLLNGEDREVPDGLTVAGLVEHLKLAGERVAVEVNLAVIRRALHGTHELREGDRVEVVTFVGGG